MAGRRGLPPLRLRLRLRLLLCVVGATAADLAPVELQDGETVEYERAPVDGWQWFVLRTNDTQAVVAGLVVQRGDNDNFPRMGFIMIASSSTVPPGAVSGTEFDPTTYDAFDDAVGPRRKFYWDSPTTPRPITDWRVLTIGFNESAPAHTPEASQVPLRNALIGVRCNEEADIWGVGSIPGCRYSLTASLLPFELSAGAQMRAPMAPGDTHAFRIDLGSYDSFRVLIERDGVNASRAATKQAYGLTGAALLQYVDWPRPRPLEYPYNLSGVPAGTDLPSSEAEFEAMLRWQHAQMRADKGLLNLRGCVYGDDGCRLQPRAEGVEEELGQFTEAQLHEARQDDLKGNLWARVLPNGRGHAALWPGVSETMLQNLCLSASDVGRYWVALHADAATSGDGRLSNGFNGIETTLYNRGPPIEGVDSTGWRNNFPGSSTPTGCWCCAEGKCDVPCTGACAVAVGQMPPASGRTVRGYRMRVEHLTYTEGRVETAERRGGHGRPGCVSYGQWRYYEVPTGGLSDSHVVVSISADVEGIYAAQHARPTQEDYLTVARAGQRTLSLSACDLSLPTVWYVGVHIGAQEEGILETRFVLSFNARSGAAAVGDEISASGCCGGFIYWRVPHVPDEAALVATVNTHKGALHAVIVQFDSCPQWDLAQPLAARCDGFCEVSWLTHWDEITGARRSSATGVVAVPMGLTHGSNDERRAGTWYVGVKTLPGEEAFFTLKLGLERPRVRVSLALCGVSERFCASAAVRAAGESNRPLTTAAQAEVPQLQYSAAAPRRARRLGLALQGGLASAALVLLALRP